MNENEMAMSRIEQLLEENTALAEENNKILRQLRRATRAAFWTRLILWAIVIILPILLLRPFINALVPVTGDGTAPLGLPSKEQIERLMRTYESGELGQ